MVSSSNPGLAERTGVEGAFLISRIAGDLRAIEED